MKDQASCAGTAAGKKSLSPEEQRGFKLVKEAEQVLNKFSWFGLANATKYDDAISLYKKAANSFKMGQAWKDAGDVFVKVADLEIKAQTSRFEAAGHYIEAGDMYRRVDPGLAIQQFTSGISMMCDDGRFGSAAKHSEKIAELYEKEADIENAMKYFQQAANYYNADNSSSRANKNLEKVAFHSGSLKKYKEAGEIFEALGKSSLESNLLKFNAKKHFLHAGLCILARSDVVAAQNCLTRYSDLDYSFRESREGKLFESLTKCVEEYDADKFADELYTYDRISKLTPWETTILLGIKQSIEQDDDEVPDLQ
mmetsp:Transcript_7367/g.8457  ORF Transcript_7367/g.8457 Transcript_7367/m.8457 type:complete len:311 (+) Transcript_7367:159-1091(+)